MNELSLLAKSLWQAPVGWLAASLLFGFLLTLLYHQIPHPYRHPLHTVRWLAIPYLGLLTGEISPRFMGLTGINWFASFGFGLVLIGGVLVVLMIVRSVMAFSFTSVAATSLPTDRGQSVPSIPQRYLPRQYATGLPSSFLAIGAEEFHLAFLRSAIWETLLLFSLSSAQAGYWAAWAALSVALPEALHYHPSLSHRLCKGALLVTTTVLFIFTRNLWLTWLLHLLGWMLLAPAAVPSREGLRNQ